MEPTIIKTVADKYGGYAALAVRLGLTRQAVWKWKAIPLKYVPLIAEDTGIPREKLRPDIYG